MTIATCLLACGETRIESDLLVYTADAWLASDLTEACRYSGVALQIAVDPTTKRYILRRACPSAAELAPIYEFDALIPRLYPIDQSSEAQIQSHAPNWHGVPSLTPCWVDGGVEHCRPGFDSLDDTVGGGAVKIAGERCIFARELTPGQYTIVVSADGHEPSPVPFFGGPNFKGQVYQQTYDLRREEYVGNTVNLPFRWNDGIWDSCPTPDARYVVYYNFPAANELVFVPTGVADDYP